MGISKKKNEQLQSSEENVDLKAQFTAVKTAVKEEESSLRKVKLKYSSCCGCGCDTIVFTRWVEKNSPLKKGDFVDSMEDDDVIL